MDFVHVTSDKAVATVTLERGKVHALNDQVVEELHSAVERLAAEDDIRAVILTGTGKFFSFGFDIPGFYKATPEEFTRFVTAFNGLYRYLFMYPKPVVAALNGHTIAGGCMLATACDYRIMVSGKAKISLNEITFGSTVFAGSVDLLKYCVGNRNAESILIGGGMYSAEEACEIGLVDLVVSEDNLISEAIRIAGEMAQREPEAYRSIKNLLRKDIEKRMQATEPESIREFIDIWYADRTREYLKKITIHS